METQNRGAEPRVHFNEAQIAEHDKDRGTRQKIDEPKTPFESSVKPVETEDGKVIDFEELTNRMSGLNATEDTTPTVVKNVKSMSFEDKRRQHYNEFTEMKKLLKRQDTLDEFDLHN